MMASEGGWRELEPRRRWWLDWQLVAAATVLTFGIAVAVVELACVTFARTTARYPLTIAVVTGVCLLFLTIFGVERLLRLTDSRRWRQPARVAIDTYVFSADRAIRTVHEGINNLLRGLENPPAHDPLRLKTKIQLLADGAPMALDSLHDIIRKEADGLGAVTMLASETIIRHEPYRFVVDDIFEIQKHFADAAAATNALFQTIGFAGGPKSSRLADLRRQYVGEIATHIQAMTDLLHTKYLQLREAEDA